VHAARIVVHRKQNRTVPVDWGRYLAEHIPGAKYVELPGDEHILHGRDGETLLAEVREFAAASYLPGIALSVEVRFGAGE
jgi:pimeloyl-ACP methyl ester carboxylesterase